MSRKSLHIQVIRTHEYRDEIMSEHKVICIDLITGFVM